MNKFMILMIISIINKTKIASKARKIVNKNKMHIRNNIVTTYTKIKYGIQDDRQTLTDNEKSYTLGK